MFGGKTSQLPMQLKNIQRKFYPLKNSTPRNSCRALRNKAVIFTSHAVMKIRQNRKTKPGPFRHWQSKSLGGMRNRNGEANNGKSSYQFSLLVLLVIGILIPPCMAQGDVSVLKRLPLHRTESIPYTGTLFETINPEDSGIIAVNEYNHPDAWTKYWHQYYNGSIGSGIAVGDINGDSRPDIYLVSKDTANTLYSNNGDFTFTDITERAGVAGKEGFGSGTSLIDIDNDGDLDLYVGYIGSSDELFINNGKGVFSEESESWGLDIKTGTNAPSFADIDRDGDLDLYIQCNFLAETKQPEGQEDFLFENKGTHFVNITEQAGIEGRGQGHSAVWWDFNEDGWPDLHVANDFERTDKLYVNNKDNTFTDVIKEVFISSPYFGMGADFGDINNDGHMDFLVADMASDDHIKHHTTIGPQGAFLLNISKTKISQYMKNMLSVKIGPDQFAETAYLSGIHATGWTWAPRLVDLDNDGWLDIYFTTGMVREFHNSDLTMRMGKASSVGERIRFHKNSPPLIEKNLSFKNKRDLSFVPTNKEWGLDLSGISFAAAFADFDKDGDLDLIINNLNDKATLYKNHSTTGDRVTLRLLGMKSNRYGIGAKVTAIANGCQLKRELSLTRGYMAHDEPHLHFAFPSAEVLDSLKIEWPSGIKQTLTHLPTNHHYLIEESDLFENSRPAASKPAPLFSPSPIGIPEETHSTEEYYNLYAKQPVVPYDETWSGPKIALGDLNNDGWLDLVMGGATGQETRVFGNDKGKSLDFIESDVFYDDYDSEDSDLVLLDYDGDMDLDLLITAGSIELDFNSEYYQDRLYIQESDLTFERLDDELFKTPSLASRGAATLDIDGDGDLDFLIGGGTVKDRYPETGSNQLWLREKEGYIQDNDSAFANAFSRSGKISELLAVDIDNDGDQDLVQALEWGSPLIWINTETDGFKKLEYLSEASNLKGIWRSVAAGDFDADGRIDLVFGNLGQNTKYRPTNDSPVLLFSQEKNGFGAHVEAYTQDGRLLPIETRNRVRKQFPTEIRRASRNYLEYAQKSLEEIFPNLSTDFSRREMNETRSMVLFQKSPGQFTAIPLPRLAQTGIAIDLLVADFNRDGADDIVISHETLPTRPWAGRIQKGHLTVLLNKGDGEFEVLLPWKSGLEVHGFPKHLAWGDLDKDGHGELLITQNDGPLLVFRQN